MLAEIIPPVGISSWAGAAGATIGAAIASWVATRKEFKKLRKDMNRAFAEIRVIKRHLEIPTEEYPIKHFERDEPTDD